MRNIPSTNRGYQENMQPIYRDVRVHIEETRGNESREGIMIGKNYKIRNPHTPACVRFVKITKYRIQSTPKKSLTHLRKLFFIMSMNL